MSVFSFVFLAYSLLRFKFKYNLVDFIGEDIEDDIMVLLGSGKDVSAEIQSLTFWGMS